MSDAQELVGSEANQAKQSKEIVELESVTIRFAGDSGDGMQLTGNQFTNTAAILGNDIETLPDYPSEIRAPAGSLPGVSAFQLHFSSRDIRTPGDRPSVLVAMNAAAFKVHLEDLETGGFLIANTNGFGKSNLKKAGYESTPLEDDKLLANYRVVSLPITDLTINAVSKTDLTQKEAVRCKNFFALGLVYHLYDRSMDYTIQWIEKKFGKDSKFSNANIASLKAGYNYADTIELFSTHYKVKKAKLPPGTYRKVTGNQAMALGLVTASKKAGRSIFYGTYPITPASDILHELAKFRHFDVKTFQAEDEIAGVASAIGASFAGNLGVTGSSGPGIALKGEAIGFAVMTELPLVVINVQRGGPSTGLPTKTEQSDLFQTLFGRNGECPLAVLAAKTPGDCFQIAFEAIRIAVTYMTPVFILSDGFLANGAEPWKIPSFADLPDIEIKFRTNPENFLPYERDSKTLARPWAIPGTPGLEHRLGGLEKKDGSGNVCYEPKNHQVMTNIRAEKIARIVDLVPNVEIFGDQDGGDLLLVGWGGTYGSITTAVENMRKKGHSVSSIHLRYLNPFPKNLKEVLGKFKKVMVPELNLGQLEWVLRAQFLVDTIGYHKMQGKPFQIAELEAEMLKHL